MSGHLHHPLVDEYLDGLRAAGKARTATTNAGYLSLFERWLTAPEGERGIGVDAVTVDVLRRYQLYLANDHRTRKGAPLAPSTQATHISILKSLYDWLARRGQILLDPAAELVLPDVPRPLVVAKDSLSQQEAQALVETTAALADEAPAGTSAKALAIRNLALVAVALATGRRVSGLLALTAADLDRELDEHRVEVEKSRTGRVLPIAPWALAAVDWYLAESRPRLLGTANMKSLFIGKRNDALTPRGVAFVLDLLVAETIRRNGDLVDLPHKRITTHSLRVSFATMMFANGCGIRSLNELLLHRSLETTARYTPLHLDDLRRVLLVHHPMA